MAIYLKLDGVSGDATQQDHKEWITLNSFQWGVGRGISTPVGDTARREASQPSVSEVTVTKIADVSSSQLFVEAVTGTNAKLVKIHLTRTGSPGDTYLEFILTDTLVSGYSMSSGGDQPSESLSLNFTKIEFNYTPFTADNKPGTTKRASFDLSTAQKS